MISRLLRAAAALGLATILQAPVQAATVHHDEASFLSATRDLTVEGFETDTATRTGYARVSFSGGTMASNWTGLPSMLDPRSGSALDGDRALYFLLPFGLTVSLDRPYTAFGFWVANLGTAERTRITLTASSGATAARDGGPAEADSFFSGEELFIGLTDPAGFDKIVIGGDVGRWIGLDPVSIDRMYIGTAAEIAAVPVPAAMVSLLSAVCLLGALRRRRA